MKKNKLILFFMSILLVVSGFLAGCSSNEAGSDSGDDDGKVEGEITVITQRTDIVDTVFKDYAAKFQEEYPDVEVNFEALADYEGQIMPRMNTGDYGDVLLIPTSIPIEDIPDFFEPLGDVEEMQEEYMAIDERAVGGKVYGIPIAVNYSGIVYNKSVFEEAGISELQFTPDEFLKALEAVKEKTDAIPLYTNYAAGWTLTQWESALATVAGDPDYVNITQPNTDDNFVPGEPHYELYKVMYDVANKGLIEKDPLTTDWETSKQMLADGDIATMVLGSWAIGQIKALTDTPEDIGYMPFPTNAEKVLFPLSADYNLAVNVNSENKAAAKAWVDFFINESGYPTEQAFGLSPAKDALLPDALSEFEGTGIEFETLTPAEEGQEGLVDAIDKEAEIGLWTEDFKKRIVEAAIGNTDETYDEIMKDLNEDWVKAREKVAE
ncbi:carbohydrate ABC transporter substrate-binding protein [Bacillus salacetis]|uniref:Carbohydrate ABC transporter substrate-binding protein n=1 Tax=Bacillus salacetis TaxID=2315464 RepID=A0A3A1QYT3_9BACI|nr:ABC transporter substrate-binding protein [Bacillus salacetis]RIW34260.1 carbohydrate ABC transporter substrate-binding protein [Bacillus salacetis]